MGENYFMSPESQQMTRCFQQFLNQLSSILRGIFIIIALINRFSTIKKQRSWKIYRYYKPKSDRACYNLALSNTVISFLLFMGFTLLDATTSTSFTVTMRTERRASSGCKDLTNVFNLQWCFVLRTQAC